MIRLTNLGAAAVCAILAAALAGCAAITPADDRLVVTCPAGQEARSTAQLFFGRNIGGQPGVSEADFRRFVDDELTPRFPDGLTVLDGGGQWREPSDTLIREASKLVLLVLPKGDAAGPRLTAVREAYKAKFRQDSVLLVTQAGCISF